MRLVAAIRAAPSAATMGVNPAVDLPVDFDGSVGGSAGSSVGNYVGGSVGNYVGNYVGNHVGNYGEFTANSRAADSLDRPAPDLVADGPSAAPRRRACRRCTLPVPGREDERPPTPGVVHRMTGEHSRSARAGAPPRLRGPTHA